jgi:hypothetical protein
MVITRERCVEAEHFRTPTDEGRGMTEAGKSAIEDRLYFVLIKKLAEL